MEASKSSGHLGYGYPFTYAGNLRVSVIARSETTKQSFPLNP
jgi:hypothetical protein